MCSSRRSPVSDRIVTSLACGFVALISANSPLLSLAFGVLAVVALFVDE